MSLAKDLLELAESLARRERQRPKQASLRRSISTSYYALFHLITSEAANHVGSFMTSSATNQMQRWFDHAEMKRVCGIFSIPAPGSLQIASILGAPVSTDLQFVARAFIQLQNARHEADYDLTSTWTRLAAIQNVDTARNAFAAWARIRRTHESNVFALALLSAKLFDKQR